MYISTFRLLLDHGANPNLSTTNTNPKLYLNHNSLEYLRLALKKGLNVDTYYDGSQLLHMACESKWVYLSNKSISIETIALLLEHGADPNAKTRGKKGSATALHLLLAKKDIDPNKVRLLLEYGADPTIKGFIINEPSFSNDNSSHAHMQICTLNKPNLAYTPLKLMGADDLQYMGPRIEAWKLPPLDHSKSSATTVIVSPAIQNGTDAEDKTNKRLSFIKRLRNKIRDKSKSNITSATSTSYDNSAETSNARQSSQPQGQLDSENPPVYSDLFPIAKR